MLDELALPRIKDCRAARSTQSDAAGAMIGAAAAAVLLAAGLAGCGSISERTAAAAFTSPGKYNVYTCQDIERSR